MKRFRYFKIELEEDEEDNLPSWLIAAGQRYYELVRETEHFDDREVLSALAQFAAAVIVEEFEDGTPPTSEDILKQAQFLHDQLSGFIKRALDDEDEQQAGETKH